MKELWFGFVCVSVYIQKACPEVVVLVTISCIYPNHSPLLLCFSKLGFPPDHQRWQMEKKGLWDRCILFFTSLFPFISHHILNNLLFLSPPSFACLNCYFPSHIKKALAMTQGSNPRCDPPKLCKLWQVNGARLQFHLLWKWPWGLFSSFTEYGGKIPYASCVPSVYIVLEANRALSRNFYFIILSDAKQHPCFWWWNHLCKLYNPIRTSMFSF